MIQFTATTLDAIAHGEVELRSARMEAWQRPAGGGANVKVADLALLDGTQDFDRGATTRRRVTAVAAGDESLLPVAVQGGTAVSTYGATGKTYGQPGATYGGYPTNGLKGLLTFGTELRVFYGVARYADGVYEERETGRYRISEVQFVDTSEEAGFQIHITGNDISADLQRSIYSHALKYAAGTNVGTVITGIIQDRLPGATVIVTPTSHTLPLTILGLRGGQSSPWDDLLKIVADIGYELDVDELGRFVAKPVPNPATSPAVWTFQDGSFGTPVGAASATLVQVIETQSNAELVNGVIVRGENVSLKTVPYATVWNDDVNSPYHRDRATGGIGEYPKVISSPFVNTAAQAQEAADAYYRRYAGLQETVEITVAPCPWIEVGDIVNVKAAGAGVSSRYVVERVSLPFKQDQPTIITCARRLD